MAFWIQKIELVDQSEVEEHGKEQEDELIDIEILDSCVLSDESSDGPVEDYQKGSEVVKPVEDNIKTAVEIAMTRIVK